MSESGLLWNTLECSYQIRKTAGCACAENAGNVFPATDFKGNHQSVIPACITARAVMHVGIANPWWRGKRFRHSRRMRNFTYLERGPFHSHWCTLSPGIRDYDTNSIAHTHANCQHSNVLKLSICAQSVVWHAKFISVRMQYRAESRFALSQWEVSLQSNAVSHRLGANIESALPLQYSFKKFSLKHSNSPAYPRTRGQLRSIWFLRNHDLGLGASETRDRLVQGITGFFRTYVCGK